MERKTIRSASDRLIRPVRQKKLKGIRWDVSKQASDIFIQGLLFILARGYTTDISSWSSKKVRQHGRNDLTKELYRK